jgi:deoxyribodipyrimidine photo-lyase
MSEDSLPRKRVKLEKTTTLHWFRTDLRLNDNTALHHASLMAKRGNLASLFVVSPAEWKAHDTAPIKVDFWMRQLTQLKKDLDTLGIPLIVKHANSKTEVIEAVREACIELCVKTLTHNIEYEVNEGIRDSKVKEALEKLDISVVATHDQCVLPPGTCLTKEGKVYTVYTPFKNTWFRLASADKDKYLTVSPKPKQHANEWTLEQTIFIKNNSTIPSTVPEFPLPENIEDIRKLWPASEQIAQERMEKWVANNIKAYAEDRNLPAKKDGSSSLSPYLASGILSARQCVSAAYISNGGKLDSGNQGCVVWIQELIWRDFYRHVLVGFPRVCKNKAFKPDTDKIKWETDEAKFEKWCQGKTGFPIVDAGMRQLLATGWMHNRLRMIVAMFLTKDLMIDWRQGEAWFMKHLIDGDFASNNGGWQWSSSTGTDSQPYFRVFNPASQSEKSDPTGVFIKQFVPELAPMKVPAIHAPKPEAARKLGYPVEMVNHNDARLKVIASFKALSSKE